MPRLTLLLTLLILAGAARAQTVPQNQPERPTIALVLSGGAAKGLAHIGAIQVFEEEGIPFDIIAGTSAGALIGSFYAVGYSGRQIEDIVRSAGPDQKTPILLSSLAFAQAIWRLQATPRGSLMTVRS